jgi:hypothetical protein
MKAVLCIFMVILLLLFVAEVYAQVKAMECMDKGGLPVTHLFQENLCLKG